MNYQDTLRGLRQVASQLTLKTDELHDEIQILTDRRTQLIRKLADINAAIATVNSFTDEGLNDSFIPPQNETLKTQLTNAIYECLLREGPLHRKTILDRVSHMGIQIGVKSPLSSLASYLSIDERFVNVGKGIWALAGQVEKATIKEEPRHSNITSEDLTGFTKLSDALAEIAKRHAGIVYCSEAAKLLVEAGVTQAANQASANAVVHRTLNYSEKWQRIEPGVFRYLPLSAMSANEARYDPKAIKGENIPGTSQFDSQTLL